MEVKKFPNALVVELSRKMKSILRKTITGNENIKVRDHIKKHKGEPKYIKFFDKIFFTLGLVILITCKFFLLRNIFYRSTRNLVEVCDPAVD